MQKLDDVLKECDHELNHGKRDYDRYDRYNQGQEGRHKSDYTVDNWAERCIEINRHILTNLAEITAIVPI